MSAEITLEEYVNTLVVRHHDKETGATWFNVLGATLNESTTPMYVDFSKGDGWAFDSFLYRESQYYHFKDKNPVEYLSRKGRVQVTFIAKDVAVVTSVTGSDRRVPAPFIVLSAAKPMSQDLTGYSYIIESVKPGGEWEPAMITFKR